MQSDERAAGPQSRCPSARRRLTSSRERRARRMLVEAWFVVAFIPLITAAAYIWRTDFRNSSRLVVLIETALFMVRTFAFHGAIVLLAIAIVALWKRKRKLACTAGLLSVVVAIPTLMHYLPGAAAPAVGEPLRVMSLNLLRPNNQCDGMIEAIRSADPGLLLMQEYTPHWHDALARGLADDYPHRLTEPREDSFGSAVFSKLPFVGSTESFLPLGDGTLPQMRVIVEHGDARLAVYNVHLLPPATLNRIIETRRQFVDLADLVRDERLPVVLAGDFNFTETSPQAAALTGLGLRDAYDVGSWGRGTTWPRLWYLRLLPSVRIDHVYISTALTCTAARVGKAPGSDHDWVMAEVALSN